MKKLLFIALLAFGMNANAQITLEHTYDSASTLGNGLNDQLMIINFESSGERYVKVNRTGHCISIYNMNHTLNKTISLDTFFLGCNYTLIDVLYISEHLFNDDNKIEFMCVSGNNTYIFNEDYDLLFAEPGAPYIRPNCEQQQLPIYNTALGTKMILSYTNGQAKVFNLPGTLSESIAESNSVLILQSSVSNPYPNPTTTTTQIDYKLPDGVNEGEIVFYDLAGNEVKRFTVDKTFTTLLVSTTDITAGTYYYQLQTTGQSSDGKKMVVIK